MTRKEKIDLLNGILKGLTPISAVFIGWPEKAYYALPDDDENYETGSGELVSMEEVDYQVMHYPKVRIVSKEPEERDVKVTINHTYMDCEGNRVPEAENKPMDRNLLQKNGQILKTKIK